MAPTLAKTLGLSALAGLASEGASQIVKKISGNGLQSGGFLIPQDKIDKLIAHKNLLTKKKKEQILNSLQSGRQLVIKPTKTQQGGFLGSLLASIGVPLLLNALTGKGLQVDRGKSNNTTSVYVPKNGGLINPYAIPPPFFGTWKNPIGLGVKKEKAPKRRKAKKGEGLLLGKNSPFNRIPLLGAIL